MKRQVFPSAGLWMVICVGVICSRLHADPAPATTTSPSPTATDAVYVATTGDDDNAGTAAAPFASIAKAVSAAGPGHTIYVRGGTYALSSTIPLTQSGTADRRIQLLAYPDEKPVLNFSAQPVAPANRGLMLIGNYWTIKGLEICNAGDNAIKVEGSHNRIELCVFHHNGDTGLQLGFGHKFAETHPGVSENDGTFCAYNDIINCDSYLNYDVATRGGNADGFACKMHSGKANRFIGCRAWDNSDDGWDLFETDFPVYIIDCWAWGSGRAKNFTVTGGSFQGNGNGIKLGGNGAGGSSKGKHEAWYCIAFNNNKTTSVKGFDQNNHKDGVKLVNCLAFGNGYDFMFKETDGESEFHNNVALGRIELPATATQGSNALPASVKTKKGWTTNAGPTVSEADFNSLKEEDAKAPRGPDGSLPTGFGRLVTGSALIDKGIPVTNTNEELKDLGLPKPYAGTAPDLGAMERRD